MRDEWRQFDMMVARTLRHLRVEENEPLWLGQIPYLDTRVSTMETKAAALGIFTNKQSTGTAPATAEQNAAEQALEEGAYGLGHLLHLYYRESGNVAKAAEWKLTQTAWRALPEPQLLSRGKTLRTEAQALTTGTPAPGAPFGITSEKVAAYGEVLDRYAELIGQPTQTRSERKAMTAQMPARYGELRDMLFDIDGMIEPMAAQSQAHSLFVEGYFNARRIGGHPLDGDEPQPPPAPPTT